MPLLFIVTVIKGKLYITIANTPTICYNRIQYFQNGTNYCAERKGVKG